MKRRAFLGAALALPLARMTLASKPPTDSLTLAMIDEIKEKIAPYQVAFDAGGSDLMSYCGWVVRANGAIEVLRIGVLDPRDREYLRGGQWTADAIERMKTEPVAPMAFNRLPKPTTVKVSKWDQLKKPAKVPASNLLTALLHNPKT